MKELEECTFVTHTEISPQAVRLLQKTTWGGEGILYTHGGEKFAVRDMQAPEVVQLERNEELVSVAVFSHRQILAPSGVVNGVYTRYFATNVHYRGLGIVSSFCRKVFDQLEAKTKTPSLFYNLVEKQNQASKAIVQKVGFAPWATIRTVGFSRFFPKQYPQVFDVCPCESEETKAWLKDVYKDYAFVHFDHLFKDNPYYVYREKGEVLAGVQVYNCEWQVKKMTGVWGFFVRKLAPFVPLLNRIFNPKSFKFLALDAVYIRKGEEVYFYRLLETLMAKQKVYAALLFADERSDLFQTFTSNKQMGLLNRFCENNETQLMVKAVHVTESESEALQKAPAYVSSYDTV